MGVGARTDPRTTYSISLHLRLRIIQQVHMRSRCLTHPIVQRSHRCHSRQACTHRTSITLTIITITTNRLSNTTRSDAMASRRTLTRRYHPCRTTMTRQSRQSISINPFKDLRTHHQRTTTKYTRLRAAEDPRARRLRLLVLLVPHQQQPGQALANVAQDLAPAHAHVARL